MLYNILKISLIFGVASVALAASIDSKDSAEYVKVGDRFYHFSNETLSWGDALVKCFLLGDVLATLERPSDQDIISRYMVINLLKDRNWWIYAADFKVEGNFRWSITGATVSNGTWAPGQPDNYGGKENCLHLKYSPRDLSRYEMNDWDCYQKANYICEHLQYPKDNESAESINNSI